MSERDEILKELHELQLLIRKQEEVVKDLPKISLVIGLASLRNREKSLFKELNECNNKIEEV